MNKFICNGFEFENLQSAVRYASFYFDVTGIVLGIEQSL